MKAVKIILVVLGLILLVIGIMGLIAPKSIEVERSMHVEASPEVVKPQVQYFENFEKWSPWAELDPDMETSIEGADGEVGTVYRWSGNENAGKGEQEITAISDNRVELALRFEEPWESTATTYFELEPEDEGTMVRWGMTSAMDFPWNIMCLFMNMEEEIGKDYDKGLTQLKAVSEEAAPVLEPQEVNGFMVQPVQFSEKTYLMKREQLHMSEIKAFFETQMPAIFTAVQEAELSPIGPPCGLYYTWNESDSTTDMAAAIPVSPDADVSGVSGDFEKVSLPAGKALQIEYYGAYEQIGAVHMAMDKYLSDAGVKSGAPVIEEYVTDPGQEPDTSKWQTNVYYPLK